MPSTHEKPLKRIKRIAWRTTAGYMWTRLGLVLVGDGHFADRLSSSAISSLVRTLDSLGFVPVSTSHVGWVVGAGWLLAITGYNLWQIALLFFYILSFPLLFLFFVFFGKEIAQVRSASVSPDSEKGGLRPKQHQRPAVALCGSALLGWYLLFGDTTASRPIWIAVVLAGALAGLLAFRAFQRAKPVSHDDTAPLLTLERMATGVINGTQQQWEKNKNQPRRNILITAKINRWQKDVYVHLAYLLRGKRGRDRIYAILVLQYALSLLLLIACAVLFWAFCLKLIAPAALPLSKCVLLSLSHFLPAVAPPTVPVQIPWWGSLGPGFTALVLLVIYVASSSSLLPTKQAAYAQRIHRTYALLRRAAGTLRVYISRLNSLPQ